MLRSAAPTRVSAAGQLMQRGDWSVAAARVWCVWSWHSMCLPAAEPHTDPWPNLCCAAGANTTWWNVYSPSRLLGLPLTKDTSGPVDCNVGPLLNWIGPFAST